MQNARRAHKIRLCGHLRRYKKIVKKTYIIFSKDYMKKEERKAKTTDIHEWTCYTNSTS